MRKIVRESIALLLFAAVSSAQYTNVQISDPSSTTPEEVTIAINPNDSTKLVAGANLQYYFFSTNAGLSWEQRLLPNGDAGDPCVIFDANGRAYYAHLSNNFGSGGYWLDRLTVHRSDDGGATWFDSLTTPIDSPKQQDKEWLSCDYTNSSFRNNLYMAWTEFDLYGSTSPTDSTQILFSRLINGTNQWTTPIRISDKGGNCLDGDSTVEGAVPAVGPNGEVYVAWAGPKGILFDRSFDGGATFGTDTFVTSMPGGWDYGVPGIYRCNGLPMTVCDISSSPHRGTIYILWADQRNGENNTDIFIVKSTDRGDSWSSPKRVNTDTGSAQQFFPSIAIDQSNGNLSVVFYDRRNYAPTDSLTDVFLATSTDGGETWNNAKISQSPFLPKSNIFFGDYTHIAAHNGMVRPIWMRLDTTKLSVWTAIIPNIPVQVNTKGVAVPTIFSLSQNYPNPFNPSTNIEYRIPNAEFVTLKVYDVLGREVTTLINEKKSPGTYDVEWNASAFPSGVYFYRLKAGSYIETKKLLLLR